MEDKKMFTLYYLIKNWMIIYKFIVHNLLLIKTLIIFKIKEILIIKIIKIVKRKVINNSN
jgi:hypothetical protein